MTMTYIEVGDLLGVLTALDPHRVITDIVTSTWVDVFATTDVTFEQAKAALIACSKSTPGGFIGPNEILAAVQPSEERLAELDFMARAPEPNIPSDLPNNVEREWLRVRRDCVKAGIDGGEADRIANQQMGTDPPPVAIEGLERETRLERVRGLARELNHFDRTRHRRTALISGAETGTGAE